MAITPAVLVVGGTSRVGAPLVRQLLDRGVRVRSTTADPRRRGPSSAVPGADEVLLDLTEPRTWAAALDGVDRLYLVRPSSVVQVRHWVRPFLERAVRAGVGHVVFQSVDGVHPGLPHWQVESDLDELGLPRAFLRPTTFHQRLLDTYGGLVSTDDVLRMPMGRGRTAFVDARDVAEVAAGLLVSSTPPWRLVCTLSSEDFLSGDEAADVLSLALGRSIRFEPVSWVQHRRELLASATDLSTVHVNLMLNASSRLVLGGSADPSLGRMLGRRPLSLKDFAEQHRHGWSVPQP